MSRRKEPAIPNELLDQLLAGGAASAAFEQGGLLDSLKKALTERALNAEMDHHLAGDGGAGNTRNGYGRKTVMTDTGKLTRSRLLHQGPSGRNPRYRNSHSMKLRHGSSDRSTRFTRSFSSTRSGSRSATKGWFATRLSISRSASAPTAPRKCSACGSSRMKARSSGSGC